MRPRAGAVEGDRSAQPGAASAPGLRLDGLPDDEVRALLRTCMDVPRWVDEVASGRPYGTADALLAAAREAAQPLTADEVEGALRHHPRIGERPTGAGAEAAMSRREQGGVDDRDVELAERLRAGNAAYEERFGRVFLIRAAGRDGAQVLAALEQRLQHDDATEERVVAEQLREIALLRLAVAAGGSAPAGGGA